jgi:protein-L-isoaspartate(D-aspartate) O-methyltransferase
VLVADLQIERYQFTGPFDVIHVGAAAPKLPPELMEQLARPGRMFIPLGSRVQNVYQIDKDGEGKVTEKKLFGVMVSRLS